MSVYGSVGAGFIGPGTGAHQLAAPSGSVPAPPRKRNHRGDDDDYPDAQASFSTCSSSRLLGVQRPPRVRPPPVEQTPGKQLPSPNPAPVLAMAKKPMAPAPAPPSKPGGNRLLMAGYLAHEFLSRGTLFGRPYGTTTTQQTLQNRKQQYEEAARILWGGGVHVPGVINPTLFGGWLQKQQDIL